MADLRLTSPGPLTEIFQSFLVFLFVLIVPVLLFAPDGHAGTAAVELGPGGPPQIFPASNKGDLSFQFLAGVLSSPAPLAARTDVFNYTQINLRMGRVLAGFDYSAGIRRSTIEGLIELTNSWIFSGYGNYLSGVTLLVRYNLITAGVPFVPYVQAGVGAVYTDAYKNYSQDAIGQAVEFTPQGSLGFHWFVKERWSLDGEVMFHHISNANLDERNGGINALGGFIGATYYSDIPVRSTLPVRPFP